MDSNCKFYGSMIGCRYGNCCRYSHSNPNSVPLCRFSNHCVYGNHCKFRHIQFDMNSIMMQTRLILPETLRKSCLDVSKQEQYVLSEMDVFSNDMKNLRSELDRYEIVRINNNNQNEVDAVEKMIENKFNNMQQKLLQLCNTQNTIHQKLKIMHSVENCMIELDNECNIESYNFDQEEKMMLNELDNEIIEQLHKELKRAKLLVIVRGNMYHGGTIFYDTYKIGEKINNEGWNRIYQIESNDTNLFNKCVKIFNVQRENHNNNNNEAYAWIIEEFKKIKQIFEDESKGETELYLDDVEIVQNPKAYLVMSYTYLLYKCIRLQPKERMNIKEVLKPFWSQNLRILICGYMNTISQCRLFPVDIVPLILRYV